MQGQPQDLTIIPLSADRIAAAHVLSLAQSWPHRVEDWGFLLALGRGFAILSGGHLVGTALLTPYGADAATVSMIIVAKEARGRGIGRRLMEHLLAEAGLREIRLIATEAGRPLYESLGFARTGMVLQCQGVATGAALPEGVLPATADDMAQLAALDRAAYGMERGDLLSRLMHADEPVLVLRDAGGVRGFAACRNFGRGALLGPLIARDDAAAAALMRAAIGRYDGRFLRADLTEAGARHLAQVTAAGLVQVDTCLAMTRPGGSPLAKTVGTEAYTLASQALC